MTTVVGRARVVKMVVSARYCEVDLLGGIKYTPTTRGVGLGGNFEKLQISKRAESIAISCKYGLTIR